MSEVTELDEAALTHFLALAAHGRRNGASGGERRCAKLAACLVDNLPGLDQEALDGFYEFGRLAHAAPTTALKLLRG